MLRGGGSERRANAADDEHPWTMESLFVEKAVRRGVSADKIALLYRYLVALEHGTEDDLGDVEFAAAADSLAEVSAIIIHRLASLDRLES